MSKPFDILELVKCNLKFYRRQTVQLILATALTTAIISGAFLIGASVKNSLKTAMHNRLGDINYGIFQTERWFNADLDDRLDNCAALISVSAYTTGDDGKTIKINLYGVDQAFFAFAPEQNKTEIPPAGTALLNRTAAFMLGIKNGKSFALRCFKPSIMPGDTAWSGQNSESVGFRLKVDRVISAVEFADFNPLNSQLAPANVFVDRNWLAERLGRKGRANILLSDTDKPLTNVLTLADYGLSLKKRSNAKVELKSKRVFISPAIAQAAESLKFSRQKIFSYFVNRITYKRRMTPYSFVAGVNALSGSEAVITTWLAADLRLKIGDLFCMSYYKIGEQGELNEASAAFKVKAIVLTKLDADLMPEFPGMSKADSCSDWEPGIAIDLKLVREKDETYWEKYRGTPKVFIALKKAQKLWGCRFGNITALRFKGVDEKKLTQALLHMIDPADVGFNWQPLSAIGQHGIKNAVDFSGLFFGLSFFVIVAGIVLSGLLYRLHLEERTSEFAVLKSMGYSNSLLGRILTLEASVILIAGIVIGVIASFAYTYLIIAALNTVWNNIVGSIQVSLSIDPLAIMLGAGISIPLSALVLFFGLRKFFKSDLKASLVKTNFRNKKKRIYFTVGILYVLLGAQLILLGTKSEVGTFFVAAVLLFIGMTCISGAMILIMPECFKGHGISTISTALRNNSRHFRSSMAVVIIMALGVFLTLAVSFNRTRQSLSGLKTSGTGGFAYYIETAIPLKGELKSLSSNIVKMPMEDGGAAGCLNLNRVTHPRLLGVAPGVFDDCFSFQTPNVSWDMLQQNDSDIIPAIADENVILWSLGLNIGDTLNYPGANGRIYKLKFVAGLDNSIMQGAVLISRANLLRMFPDVRGSQVLLIEQADKDAISGISRSLARLGPDIESCASRLNRFGAIQNTYLMVFLSLGGIGLIIGTLGLSIILRRNLLERRGEIAWLRSAGFSRRRIAFMLTIEHIILFDCAVFTGIIAALSAGIPVMLLPSGNPPWLEMILLIAVLWIFALVFIISAAYSASKGDIISGLRGE